MGLENADSSKTTLLICAGITFFIWAGMSFFDSAAILPCFARLSNWTISVWPALDANVRAVLLSLFLVLPEHRFLRNDWWLHSMGRDSSDEGGRAG